MLFRSNTFPTVLAASAPNNGSATVTLPNTATTTARIKVEAVGNIFFDISDSNFTITAGVVAAGPLEVDGSDISTRYQAATDGLLILRYLLGYRGGALTAGALGGNPTRSATQIENHIQANLASFDVDGDNKTLATTDGVMILRRLLGLSGAALTAGAKNNPLKSDTDVAAAIDALKP